MERKQKFLVGILLSSLLTLSVAPYSNVKAQNECVVDALVPVSYGTRGMAVRNAQLCLMEAGYNIPAGATGYYGSQTRSAVRDFYADWYGSWNGNNLGPRGVAKLKEMISSAQPSQGEQQQTPTLDQNLLLQILSLISQGNVNEALNLLSSVISGQPPTGQQATTTPSQQQQLSGEVSVSLASDNPAAGTLIAKQTGAVLLKFVVNNGTSSNVTINSLKVKRGGVSSDSTLSNVYLYANNQRVSDPASVSQGYANFTGLNVQVGSGSSVIFSVVADIADATQGQTVNLSLQSANDISGVTVSGNFPLSGNTFNIAATPSDFANVALTGVQPNTTGQVDAGTNAFKVFGVTAQVNQHNVLLHSLRLRMIGSISPNDLQNFVLYVDGQQVATSSLGSDNHLVFTPSSPYTLRTGNRNIEVRADIISGSTRQFSFSLRYPSDLNVIDSQYNVGVPVSGVPATTGSQTISGGSLTVEKLNLDTTYVVKDSRKPLAKFQFRAYGEPVKVETLTVGSSFSGQVQGLRNGAIYVNGSQVGSTQTLNSGGVTFNNLNFVVNPGTPVTVEIWADVVDAGNSARPTVGTTDLKVTLKQGTNNAQATQSLNLLNVPNVDRPGDQLTVVAGGAQLLKNLSYGNSTFVKGKQGAKIASYVVSANQHESLTLNSFTVSFSSNPSNTYQNLRLSVNPSNVKGVLTTDNNFSLSLNIPAGGQQVIDVFADVLTSASTGSAPTLSASISFVTLSGQSGSINNISGQTVNIANSGTLTASLSPTTPQSQYVLTDSSNVEFSRIKLTADNNEAIKVEEITVQATTTKPGFFQNIEVNGIQQGTWNTSGTNTSSVTFTGLNIQVPQNGNLDLVIKADIAPWTAVNETTGMTVVFGITNIKYRGVDSGQQNTITNDISGNSMTVYRSRLDASLVSTGIKGPSASHDVAYLNLTTAGNESGYKTSDFNILKLTFRGSALAPFNADSGSVNTISNFVKLVEGNSVIITVNAIETGNNTGVFEANINIPSANQETGATRQLIVRLNSAGADASSGKYFTVAVEAAGDIQWEDRLASNAPLDTKTSPLSGLSVTVNY